MPSLVSASVSSTAAGAISLLFGFLSSVATARLLGPEGAGLVAYCLWIAAAATTFSDLGIPAILLRYASKCQTTELKDGGLTRALIGRFLAFASLFCVGLVAYAHWKLSSGAEGDAVLWLVTSVYFLAFTGAHLAIGVDRGLFRFFENARLTVIGCVLQLPVLVVGAYFWGPAGAMIGYVVRYLPQITSLRLFLAGAKERQGLVTKQMKQYGRNVWFSNVVGIFVWSRMEFLFLGLFASPYELGLYAAGLTLANLVVQLPTQMLAGLTPHFSRHHDAQNIEQLVITYQRVFRWISLILFPIAFGGAAITSQLVPLLFGTEFQSASNMTSVLLVFSAATGLSLIPSAVIGARERSDFFLWASPMSAVFSVIVLGSIIPFFGAEGAAWARGLVHLSWLLLLAVFSWRFLEVQPKLKDLLSTGTSALLCAAFAYAMIGYMPNILGLIVAVPGAALIYLIMLRLFRAIPAQDVESLQNNLPSKLPRPLVRLGMAVVMLLVPRTAQRP